MKAKKATYHHGDLRQALINTARDIIKQDGIDGLSLRKLADRANVSRTAPYHHFADKTALLCAIAEAGFVHWYEMTRSVFERDDLSLREQYALFVRSYIGYAADNPELYDMMFNRDIWKKGLASEALKNEAFPCFQFQVDMTREWQEKGLLPADQNTLRLTQVAWATMHGIARLLIDGIYADSAHIDEMCECAVDVFCGMGGSSNTTPE